MVVIAKIAIDQLYHAIPVSVKARTGNTYCIMDDLLDITTQDKIRQCLYIGASQYVNHSTYPIVVSNAAKIGSRERTDLLWLESQLYTTPQIPAEISKVDHVGWLLHHSVVAPHAELAPATVSVQVARRNGTNYGRALGLNSPDYTLSIEDAAEDLGGNAPNICLYVPEPETKPLPRGNQSLEGYSNMAINLATVTTGDRTLTMDTVVSPVLAYNLTPEEVMAILSSSTGWKVG